MGSSHFSDHRPLGSVTGGGGSIGSELCRQILRLGPARLVVVDSSEFNLYRIGQEILTSSPDGETRIEMVLGDVSRAGFVEEVFVEHAPEVVLHAAAYKHVPIVESAEPEGVRSNTLGTRVVVEAAARHDADHFVLVSTDKAVRPTNVMGATSESRNSSSRRPQPPPAFGPASSASAT